ncbi:MAG TPA: penicillin acylase family protein [Pirellulales bacterium]|jgi:penicillin amidase|nr:penicillin acylase family protein [Pirellulales bacterium]
MKPLSIKHARRHFEAARDDHGVPHIKADSWLAALYALGYLHAVDRPTQLLFARVIASGESADLIADRPALVETDLFFRRIGLYKHLDREVSALDDETFRQVTAYCEGVNDGLHQAGRSLPMWATGFQPQPWNQRAVLLIGNLLNYNGLVVSQQENERLLLELVQSGVRPELLAELFEPLFDGCDFELLKQIKISNRLSDEALELITDLPRLVGSNAWAVAPGRSASGHALLASDPHLEVNRLPPIWYEAVLNFGNEYVMGATLPGCPIFAVGRTRHLAWGVTYLKADTSDFFTEDCRRAPPEAVSAELPVDPDAPAEPVAPPHWQYRRGQEWVDFQVRLEHVRGKNGASRTLNVYENPQGTMEVDLADGPEGLYLCSAWTGSSEGVGESVATWLELVGCHSTRDAMDTVIRCPQPTLMWVFADTAGHIGRQACGWVPRRAANVSGVLPIPAWDPANHWQGWLGLDELPSTFDPPEGYVASANENPEPPGRHHLVTQPLSNYRKRRIVARLEAMPQATLADMEKLQYDVVSVQADDLLKVFLPCLEDGELRRRLEAWDRSYDPASLEATLFTRLYRSVLVEIFGQDTVHGGGLGWRRMVYLVSRVGFSMMVVTCVDRLLQKEHSRWWQGRDKGALIRRAAERVLDAPEQSWAVFNAFRFTNRFFESQFVGRALGFHTSELPMRGCHATPFQGHLLRSAKRETTFAPSYHFVTDLGTNEAHTNLPGGPSESWLSRWYKNDIPLWLDGRYKLLAAADHKPAT